MKIRRSDTSSASVVRRLFKDRKFLIRGLAGAAGLAALSLLFLGVVGLGAYLGKLEQYAYVKPTLLQISELDFSFLKDYAKGKRAAFDEVAIEIGLKDLAELNSLREQALEEGVVSEAVREKSFPASLSFQGRTHDVRIALAGLMALHLKDPDCWPFHVKATGAGAIEGMEQFDLLPSSKGGYMTDWLGYQLLQEKGIKSMQGDFVRVSVNGKDGGVFYLQERFDDKLAENRRFGPGILFRIGEGLDIPGEGQLMDNPETKEQLLLLRRMWQGLQTGELPLSEFFDLEKAGQLFAISDLMGHHHPLLRENLNFYFDPNARRVEPISCAFTGLGEIDPHEFESVLEKPGPGSPWHSALAEDPLLRMICDDLGFKRHYIREADRLTQEEFIENLLMRNGEKMDFLLNKIYKNWPAHSLPTQTLLANQRNLRFVLYPDEGEATAYFNRAEAGGLNVSLRNQQDIPLEVAYLGWRDTVFFSPEEPLILRAGRDEEGQPKAFHFKFPEGFTWSDTLLPELKVFYNLVGLPPARRSALVFPWPYENRQANNRNPIARDANHSSFRFIEEEPETGVITIPKGNWTVDRDLVIPGGRRLEVEPGATVDIRNDAKVICYSPVFFRGTAEEPILVHSSDTSSQGVLIIGASEERSLMEHTTFRFISRSKEFGWGVTGALVLYETPVDFRNVAFIGNREGDDFLNVIRADFTMDQVLFKDIKADAFDCDFCTGVVANSSFVNVGNDGIDVSGTRIRVSHVTMDGIGDKGLSAGEGSDMEAQYVSITNAEIALTSKDRSRLVISDSEVTKSRIGFAIFEKKSEFGPAFVRADRVKIDGAELPYAIEKNSGFILDGANFPPNRDDVKAILYGAEFGKASVR